MIARTVALEEESRRLKKMFAELSIQNELLKEAVGKSGSALHSLTDDSLAINERANAGRWPKWLWRDEVSALLWIAGVSGSAKPAIATTRSCK